MEIGGATVSHKSSLLPSPYPTPTTSCPWSIWAAKLRSDGAYRVCFVHTARASESHSRRSDLAGDAAAATPPPCGRVGSGGCRDGRDGRRRGAAGVSLPSDCCPPSSYAPPPAHSPREDDALPSLRRFPEDRSTPGTSHAIFRRE